MNIIQINSLCNNYIIDERLLNKPQTFYCVSSRSIDVLENTVLPQQRNSPLGNLRRSALKRQPEPQPCDAVECRKDVEGRCRTSIVKQRTV